MKPWIRSTWMRSVISVRNARAASLPLTSAMSRWNASSAATKSGWLLVGAGRTHLAEPHPLGAQGEELLAIARQRGATDGEVLEREAHVVELVHGAHIGHPRTQSARRVAHEVAVALQPPQRLADGRAGGVVLVGEPELDQSLGRRHISAQQPCPKVLVDPLGVRRPPGRGADAGSDARDDVDM
ncbi:MAG: hypothetical protein PGN13_09385 [Patulibacter minatonensis]